MMTISPPGKQAYDRLKTTFSKREDVELALLFGSRASGKAGDLSDVDIAVLFSDRPTLLALGGLIQEASDIMENKVDLVELNGLETQDPGLAYEIVSSSFVLFERSDTVVADFRTKAYLSFFDAQSFLDSAINALDGRIQSGTFARPIHA
ncbi:MAG: nucleotidyltransferase domain-containing protein [Rectinemataceae bacterium]|jgi:predicted nucleotidyltransferase